MENIYQKASAFDKNKNKTYSEWIRWVGVEDDLESACNPFSGVKGAVMVLFFVGLLTAAFFFVLRALFGEIEFWVALVAAAVIYWGAVIPLLPVVKNKTDGYYKQLLEIEKEGNKNLFDYWNAALKEMDVTGDGYMCFNNGIAVGPGGHDICVFLGKNYGKMKLWSCGPGFERDIKKVKYDNFKQRKDKVLLNKQISSEEFNQNFYVVADKGTEDNCLEYLSPERQLNMVNGKKFYKFVNRSYDDNHLFEIYGDKLFMKVNHEGAYGGCCGYRVFPNDGLELEASSLTSDLKRVDLYRETFPKVALQIATVFDEYAGFLRGSEM
ncbi:MAG: hypothetical protein IJF27_02345 [Oscillospiraceae bacterium]|nr:hypothetical protein [Oscillospiraceae bacterium]